MSAMISLDQNTAECNRHGQPTGYHGEHGQWLIALAVHRDSPAIDRCNFTVLLDRLGGESDTVSIERFNHWAVGWGDYLLIDPTDTVSVSIAQSARESLDDYPILDEEALGSLEYSEFWEFAESELNRYDGGDDVLTDVMQNHNSGPGDDYAEWEMIEQAREILKARED